MSRPVDQVRSAVRRCLDGLPPGEPVLVACSGGADSLALAAGTAQAARGRPVGAVVVDHLLQPGSSEVAAGAARQCRDLGLDSVVVVAVQARAEAGGPGPEGAAREARLGALRAQAGSAGACAVLLGHTRDDQAETVLLGLARGSGARSLAGMRPVNGILHRPLLELSRATVRAAAEAWGLHAHEDPWNDDPAYARVRVRSEALPALEAALGPGIAAALARSAALLRDDADLLDALAAEALGRLGSEPETSALGALPPALRSRALRSLLLESGVPAGALTRDHVAAVERLATHPRTRGPVWLPAGYIARRVYGRLRIEASSARPSEET